MTETSTKATPESLAAGVTAFATLPDVYARIKKTLDDPASTHMDVADVIASDPAIAARVLKIANSAFYGRSGTIARISQAVGLLGTQQVHDLVLATVVIAGTSRLFRDQAALLAFWRQSLTTASAAKSIAEHCHILDSERLFVAGLISQLGQLVLQQSLPEQAAQLSEQADAARTDVARRQRDHLGFDHAAVAAALFRAWKLPPELTDPIRWQTQPSMAGERMLEASILHVGAAVAAALIDEGATDDLLAGLDDTAWQATELTREQLDTIREATVALTEAMAPIITDLAA